jgi:hypothetical protein
LIFRSRSLKVLLSAAKTRFEAHVWGSPVELEAGLQQATQLVSEVKKLVSEVKRAAEQARAQERQAADGQEGV